MDTTNAATLAAEEGESVPLRSRPGSVLLTSDPAWSLDYDLRKAASSLGPQEVRFLVDSYYAVQDMRKQNAQRLDAAAAAGEPNALVHRLFLDSKRMEDNIKYALASWGKTDEVCQWAITIPGIGPVISAGLRAYVKVGEDWPTAGSLWRLAGLDPSVTWGKGEKRPWNAGLKTLCWKIGESFVKVKGKETDIYGHVYDARKEYETQRNEAGVYADQAATILKARPNHAQAAIYKTGKLPPGHIHSRAKRYAVKLFLSHWYAVAYEVTTHQPPPLPYIFSERASVAGLGEGHSHYEGPPNWPLVVAEPKVSRRRKSAES